MSEVANGRRGQLQRVAAVDFAVADEMLRTAALVTVPEDQTQRQAFEKLMPHMYVLRNKGCSWGQLAKLLGQCGFKLQPSTVRSYYSEMLAARMDVCQKRMNEQIAVLAAIRTETAGADLSAISGRVNALMSRLQQTTESKVDALLGLSPGGHVIEAAPSVSQPPATPHLQRPSISAPQPLLAPSPSPAPSDATDDDSSENPGGEFGLLGLGPAQASSGGPAGFFTLDNEPTSRTPAPVPAAGPSSGPAKTPAVTAPAAAPAARPHAQARPQHAEPSAAPIGRPSTPAHPPRMAGGTTGSAGAINKRIFPLQDGVPPLKPRPNVPEEVYDAGTALLEHPAIPGMMLNLEQRLYGAALEYCDLEGDEEGVMKIETATEKRHRVTWRKIVPMTPTRTADSFTKMDPSLFPTKPAS